MAKEVGLGSRVQVIMRSEVIRIQDASEIDPLVKISQKGWDIFQALGIDAPAGRLKMHLKITIDISMGNHYETNFY